MDNIQFIKSKYASSEFDKKMLEQMEEYFDFLDRNSFWNYDSFGPEVKVHPDEYFKYYEYKYREKAYLELGIGEQYYNYGILDYCRTEKFNSMSRDEQEKLLNKADKLFEEYKERYIQEYNESVRVRKLWEDRMSGGFTQFPMSLYMKMKDVALRELELEKDGFIKG